MLSQYCMNSVSVSAFVMAFLPKSASRRSMPSFFTWYIWLTLLLITVFCHLSAPPVSTIMLTLSERSAWSISFMSDVAIP